MVSRFVARLLCVAGIALSFVVPSPVRAEDDATIEMARQRFREGVQYFDQRQYEKARLAFLQAYALKPHPSVLLNLAQSELRANRPEESANHFAEYLRGTAQVSEQEKNEAELGFNAAKAKVGELSISADPSGVQVFVDNIDRGVSPLAGPVYVVPGSHTIEARSSEQHASKTVAIGAGQSTSVALSVRSTGSVVAATPEAPAADGESTPSEPQEASASAAASTDTSGGRKNFFVWLADTKVAWVTTGVGVAGLAVGGVFAGLSTRDYSTANNFKDHLNEERAKDVKAAPEIADKNVLACDIPTAGKILTSEAAQGVVRSHGPKYAHDCQIFNDAADSGDRNRTIAIIGTAVGGAALIGTVIYYFVDADEPAGEQARKQDGFHARLVPWSGPGANGIGISGSF